MMTLTNKANRMGYSNKKSNNSKSQAHSPNMFVCLNGWSGRSLSYLVIPGEM